MSLARSYAFFVCVFCFVVVYLQSIVTSDIFFFTGSKPGNQNTDEGFGPGLEISRLEGEMGEDKEVGRTNETGRPSWYVSDSLVRHQPLRNEEVRKNGDGIQLQSPASDAMELRNGVMQRIVHEGDSK